MICGSPSVFERASNAPCKDCGHSCLVHVPQFNTDVSYCGECDVEHLRAQITSGKRPRP